MSYELKSSIQRNKIGLPIKIVTLIVVLLVIFYFVAPNILSNTLLTIIKPFWSVNRGDAPSVASLSSGTQNILIQELQNENNELKSILGRDEQNDYVMAYILKKPPYIAYDTFVLDVGTDHNIKVGDKVYSSGNILIGDIAEVYSSTSKVKLYSSSGTKYEVLIGEANIQATATGRGGGSFETALPRDVKVSEGDVVSIPDISNTVFGIVGKIIADPVRSFSIIIFSQPINIYEQKWVLVSLTNKYE
jgi:cell shape-determining protein MreC